MINMISGGEWFAMFRGEDGTLHANQVVCWVAELKPEGHIVVQGYVAMPTLCPAELCGNFVDYRFQYREEKIMRRETRSIE